MARYVVEYEDISIRRAVVILTDAEGLRYSSTRDAIAAKITDGDAIADCEIDGRAPQITHWKEITR